MATYRMITTQGCGVQGKAVPPNTRVELGVNDALDLLTSGRGPLVDPADLMRLRTEHLAHIIALERRSSWVHR